MEITYKNKRYDVLEVNGDWRVYSDDPNFTKEEAKEVIKVVKHLKNNKTTKEWTPEDTRRLYSSLTEVEAKMAWEEG